MVHVSGLADETTPIRVLHLTDVWFGKELALKCPKESSVIPFENPYHQEPTSFR